MPQTDVAPTEGQRAALITGASRGIGRAIAEALGREGYALTIASQNEDNVAEAAADLENKGFTIESVVADVAEESDLENLVQKHRARFGRLDVLVNNAGVGVGRKVEEQTAADVDWMYAINLRPMTILYRECVDLLRAAGAEHANAWVINVSSVSGIGGEPGLSGYSATKAGMIGFTEAMNEELNDDGIKSVALCPGYVYTDLAAAAAEADGVSVDEMVSVDDIAKAVQFLVNVSPSCLVPELVLRRPSLNRQV